MKARDLANLLNRAAAAIETPGDLSDRERVDVVEDLTTAAKEIEGDECGAMAPPASWTAVPVCALPRGHEGNHRSHYGIEWGPMELTASEQTQAADDRLNKEGSMAIKGHHRGVKPASREEVAQAMLDCLLVYGEKPGLLVIGVARFWRIVESLQCPGAGPVVDVRGDRVPVIAGITTLVVTRYPELLLAVPESKADEVRIKLQAEESGHVRIQAKG